MGAGCTGGMCGGSPLGPVNPPGRNETIAIIGAGPAGLMTAQWLVRHGYKNVQLFESAPEVGGFALTVNVDGRAFDLSTKFFPSSTAKGLGPLPEFKNLVDEYKVETMETYPPVSFDTEKQEITPIPPALADFPSEDIIRQVIEGFDLVVKFNEERGILDILENKDHLIKQGETIVEFGKRMNLEAFAALCLYLSDVFGAGPSVDQSAAFFLSYREHYISTYIWTIIKKGLKKAGWFDKLKLQALIALTADEQLKEFLTLDSLAPHFIFTNGFQSFYDALVKYEKLVVHLEEAVTSLRRSDNDTSWVVGTSKDRSLEFDVVICATGPQAYKKFMPPEHPIVGLMDQCVVGPGIEAWCFSVEEWGEDANKRFGRDRGGWVLSEPTAGFTKGTVEKKSRPYAFSKEFSDSNVLVAIAYPDPEIPVGEAGRPQKEAILRKCMLEWTGLVVTYVHHFEGFPGWPAQVPASAEANGWHQNARALQGKQKSYFVGEPFYSLGVMSSIDGTAGFMPLFFDSSNPSPSFSHFSPSPLCEGGV